MLKTQSRVIGGHGTIGLVMETRGWTQRHKLKALLKLNRKQPKKITSKIEPISNPIHEIDERAQLSVKGLKDDTFWQREFGGKSSVTKTQMCSLKVPKTTSWSNGSCNLSVAPFKTMWTRYGSFGKLEVSDDNSEPVRNITDKKLEFCGERSWVTF